MIDSYKIIRELSRHKDVFRNLLEGYTEEEEFLWKPEPDKWCLLEIICHLYDEEREDFRARVRHSLENPELPLSPIDPVGWVSERKYLEQDYAEKLRDFIIERERSVEWLKSLENPNWENTHQHPNLGAMPAKLFLNNWLAHDYIHIRQIIKVRYAFLEKYSDEKLNYAGDW